MLYYDLSFKTIFKLGNIWVHWFSMHSYELEDFNKWIIFKWTISAGKIEISCLQIKQIIIGYQWLNKIIIKIIMHELHKLWK